jgi:4-hydroxy-tetrahydrodipicolinate synthase
MPYWRGVFPAALTQFGAGGELDRPATMSQLDALIAGGAHGLVLLGTLGENSSLEADEKRDVIRAAVERVAGRVPVLAGVAECTTAAACRFAADGERLGLNGLMVLPAMVYKSDPRETAAHFRAVAAASGLPVMIYNNPISYGVDLPPEALAELADEPKFVAVKESSDDVRRITDIVNLLGDRFAVFCGVDDLALEAILLGADGWVAGLVNAFPAETRKLWDLATTGRLAEARALYRWFMPLLHLDTHVKLVQYIKLAAQECGLGTEAVRMPRMPLTGAERDRVLRIIRAQRAQPVCCPSES